MGQFSTFRVLNLSHISYQTVWRGGVVSFCDPVTDKLMIPPDFPHTNRCAASAGIIFTLYLSLLHLQVKLASQIYFLPRSLFRDF